MNTADRLAHTLTVRLLRGEWPAGAHLPTVRALAREQGVNPATVQRALARLEATGLVEVRHGSGVRVLDAERSAQLALLPAWLEALSDRPRDAARLLGDFLEVRRAVAGSLLVRHRERLVASLDVLGEAAGEVVAAREADPHAFCQVDLAFARTLLALTGNRAAPAVLTTAARLLDEVPGLVEAMYAEPSRHLAALRSVLEALDGDEGDLRMAVEDALASVDGWTVTRFEASLRAAA